MSRGTQTGAHRQWVLLVQLQHGIEESLLSGQVAVLYSSTDAMAFPLMLPEGCIALVCARHSCVSSRCRMDFGAEWC